MHITILYSREIWCNTKKYYARHSSREILNGTMQGIYSIGNSTIQGV